MPSAPLLRPYAADSVIDGVQLFTRDANRDLIVTDVLVAGDVQVSKAGGAFANIATLPTQEPAGSGLWRIELSAAELSAPRVAICFVDQTVTKVFADVVVIVETYGDGDAEYLPDWTNAESAFNAQLLVGSATDRSVPISDALTRYASRSWFVNFNVTGEDSTDWETFAFTVKRDADAQSDAESDLMVRVTYGGASDDGVIYFAGQPAGSAIQSLGSIVVSGVNPTAAQLHVKPGATDLPPGAYAWELTRYRAGDADVIGQGVFTLARSVIRGTTSP